MGRGRGRREKNGDRTNGTRRGDKRRRKRDEERRKRATVRREGEARGGIPEDGRRVVSTITNTAP